MLPRSSKYYYISVFRNSQALVSDFGNFVISHKVSPRRLAGGGGETVFFMKSNILLFYLNRVLNWFQNWDHITRVIAISGFLISLYNLFYGVITQRRNFEIRVYDIKSYEDVTFLLIGIENHSRISVSITQITSRIDGENTVCTAFPTQVRCIITKVNDEPVGSNFLLSTPLPITVPGLSANSALVLFEGLSKLPQNSATHLPVQVCTTRGRPLEMKWLLPEGWASRRNIDPL